MNFFEGQALARRNTRRLVLLYFLAVIAVIAAVDLVLAIGWTYATMDAGAGRGGAAALAARLAQAPPSLVAWGAAVTGAIIFGISGVEVLRLAGGGDKVAAMVGARRVSPETRDPLERRLLNVVEEMSIASGVRLPGVYVMDGEKGVNAFAAGYDVSNAVVAVTRGTLETLNRDELQAVIGHEFSHILNGDMRLNIRMMGVLAGIVFIGAIGEFLMRGTARARSRDGGTWAVFAAGLALLVIGYVGLFFARLIKAAVSRQREFLADASSVQFTRNPDGIAGALDQIDASSRGTRIDNRHAEDMSHMFFGQSVKMWFGGLFDTHPPLAARIRMVHPKFDAATYRRSRARPLAEGAEGAAIATGFGRSAGFASGKRASDLGQAWGRSAAESAAVVGSVEAENLDYARLLIAGMPAPLKDRLHDAEGACAVILALMLAPKDEVMQAQLAAARAAGADALATAAAGVSGHTRRLGAAFRLPVVDLALPAAKRAPEARQRELLAALKAVIEADRRVSLHEFAVLTLVRSQLAPGRRAAGSRRLGEAKGAALALLYMVAQAGTRGDSAEEHRRQCEGAMRAGIAEMGLDVAAPAAPKDLSMDAVTQALGSLEALAPMQKALLVKGLFAAVSYDGTIRIMEAELMRTVCAALDCPLPPLLTEIDPATLAA